MPHKVRRPKTGAGQRAAAPVVGPHVRDFDIPFRKRLGIQRVVDVDDHNALGDGLGAHPYQLKGVCRRDDDGRVAPGNEVFDDADLMVSDEPPNATFWFGTDNQGRDILSRVIYGARISLSLRERGRVFL